MLVRVMGGTLIDVRGRRAVIIPCMFVQAAATCIIAIVALLFWPSLRLPVLPFLFLAGFLAGGAHGWLYPAMSALLMDVTLERRRGSAVGIFSSVILLGNTTGAVVFGYVAHGLGYAIMWSALDRAARGGLAPEHAAAGRLRGAVAAVSGAARG